MNKQNLEASDAVSVEGVGDSFTEDDFDSICEGEFTRLVSWKGDIAAKRVYSWIRVHSPEEEACYRRVIPASIPAYIVPDPMSAEEAYAEYERECAEEDAAYDALANAHARGRGKSKGIDTDSNKDEGYLIRIDWTEIEPPETADGC